MKLNLENLKNNTLVKTHGELIITLQYSEKLNRIEHTIITKDNKKYAVGISLNFNNTIEFFIKRFGENNWEITQKIKLADTIDLEFWKDEKYRINKYSYKHPSDFNISEKEFLLQRVIK